jgi:hypothetical protein
MNLRTPLACAAALLAVAPGAASAAGPHYVPVADGVVEHRIRTMQAEASYTIAGQVPRHVRIEEWIADDRYRSTMTDVASGRLVAETVQRGDRVAIWNRDEGTFTSSAPKRNGVVRMLGHSFATEAALQQAQIDMGWYHQTGETADTLEYTSDPDAPSDGDNTTTLVLRRTDLTIVRRETLSRLSNGGWFRQTEQTELTETLDEAAVLASVFSSARAKLASKAKAARKRAKKAKRSSRR